MRTYLRHFLEIMSANFWMIPLFFLVGSIALAFFNFYLDTTLIARHIQFPQLFLYFNNSENIRTLLSVSATSVLGVAGVSFSITIASLTLASQQFGSRLLRNFMMDRFNQTVLGIFIGTFLYCIMLLQFTSSMDLDKTTPFISMIGLLILIFISLLVLVFFIHHIAVSIQADSVIADVNGELQSQLKTLFPDECNDVEHLPKASSQELTLKFEKKGKAIFSQTAGYLQAIDVDSLVKFVTEGDIAVKLVVKPGDFLIKNSVIGYGLVKDAQEEDFQNTINQPVNNYFLVGERSTAEQDPEFAIRQLVEVAVRALSPGINDPFTAVTCIDRLGDNIAFLMSRQFPSDQYYDEAGHLRLQTKPFTFESIVETSFNQIRQHGKTDVAVTIRLLETLLCLADQVKQADQAKAIKTQAYALHSVSKENFNAKKDQDDIETYYQKIYQAIKNHIKPNEEN